jgi:hypothetical protein
VGVGFISCTIRYGLMVEFRYGLNDISRFDITLSHETVIYLNVDIPSVVYSCRHLVNVER